MEEGLSQKPKIELVAWTHGPNVTPEKLVAYAAAADFEPESLSQLIHNEDTFFRRKKLENELKKAEKEKREPKYTKPEDIPQEKIDKYRKGFPKGVLEQSAGKSHTEVLSKAFFEFSIENLTRVATLMLCGPEYLMHQQQSLRRAKASRGFYWPEDLLHLKEPISAQKEGFILYGELVEYGLPGEDSRDILSLNTRTNISTTVNAREGIHLDALVSSIDMPTSIVDVVQGEKYGMMPQLRDAWPDLFEKREHTYELLGFYPAPILFAPKNNTIEEIIDEHFGGKPGKPKFIKHPLNKKRIEDALKNRYEPELSNLKHVHNGSDIEAYAAPMHIACFHQSTRNRTTNQAIQAIYQAVGRGWIFVAPKIMNSRFEQRYIEQTERMIGAYKDAVNDGTPKHKVIGAVPHNLVVWDLLHMNGFNTYSGYIGNRDCKKAQYFIRGIAKDIADDMRERGAAIGDFAYSKGRIFGECPEANPCKGGCPEFKSVPVDSFYKIR